MVEGFDAVLRRRGAPEAGTVFVTVDRLDGTADLYGPAPQSMVTGEEMDRVFAPVLTGADAAEVEARMGREIRFDPDLWWIAIEDRLGRPGLDLIDPDPAPRS